MIAREMSLGARLDIRNICATYLYVGVLIVGTMQHFVLSTAKAGLIPTVFPATAAEQLQLKEQAPLSSLNA